MEANDEDITWSSLKDIKSGPDTSFKEAGEGLLRSNLDNENLPDMARDESEIDEAFAQGERLDDVLRDSQFMRDTGLGDTSMTWMERKMRYREIVESMDVSREYVYLFLEGARAFFDFTADDDLREAAGIIKEVMEEIWVERYCS